MGWRMNPVKSVISERMPSIGGSEMSDAERSDPHAEQGSENEAGCGQLPESKYLDDAIPHGVPR